MLRFGLKTICLLHIHWPFPHHLYPDVQKLLSIPHHRGLSGPMTVCNHKDLFDLTTVVLSALIAALNKYVS